MNKRIEQALIFLSCAGVVRLEFWLMEPCYIPCVNLCSNWVHWLFIASLLAISGICFFFISEIEKMGKNHD